jgi:hypothetical protein
MLFLPDMGKNVIATDDSFGESVWIMRWNCSFTFRARFLRYAYTSHTAFVMLNFELSLIWEIVRERSTENHMFPRLLQLDLLPPPSHSLSSTTTSSWKNTIRQPYTNLVPNIREIPRQPAYLYPTSSNQGNHSTAKRPIPQNSHLFDLKKRVYNPPPPPPQESDVNCDCGASAVRRVSKVRITLIGRFALYQVLWDLNHATLFQVVNYPLYIYSYLLYVVGRPANNQLHPHLV